MREDQASLQEVAASLSSAPAEMGIPDTCVVRSLLVELDGLWVNHSTVLRAGHSDQPPRVDLLDYTAGQIRLIAAEFSAREMVDASSLINRLTAWRIALPPGFLEGFEKGQFGPRVVPRPWDFQETTSVYHNASRSPWGTLPCWVIDIHDRARENRRAGPRGPFKNLAQRFFAESLGAATMQWCLDPTVRESQSIEDSYHVHIPDRRAVLRDMVRRGDDLFATLDGSKAGSVVCALTISDSRGVHSRDQRTAERGQAIFRLPEGVTGVDLFVFDESESWCDQYSETEIHKPWGKSIVVVPQKERDGFPRPAETPVLEEFERILLEPEQIELLQQLVEAWRNTPRDRRRKFLVTQAIGGESIIHPGIPESRNRVYVGDIETLAAADLLNLSSDSRGAPVFDIRPLGFRYYEYIRTRAGESAERIQQTVLAYIDPDKFGRRYPQAYEKWAEAEKLLWASDSERQLTTIGHLCREAAQFFATALVERTQPIQVDPNPAHTVARLRAVLDQCRASLPDSVHALLDALLAYWGTVNDLIQRQEHSAQKESLPLLWKDGRLLVFQTAMVMYELDEALSAVKI